MEGLLLAWFDVASGSLWYLAVAPLLVALGAVAIKFSRPRGVKWLLALALLGLVGFSVAARLGKDRIHAWIAETGAEGALVLTRTEATGNQINHRDELRWVGQVRRVDGSLHPFQTATHALRIWPPIDGYVPRTAEALPVRYRPAWPDLVVVVPADPQGVQRCVALPRALNDLNGRIALLSGEAKAEAERQRMALVVELARCAGAEVPAP